MLHLLLLRRRTTQRRTNMLDVPTTRHLRHPGTIRRLGTKPPPRCGVPEYPSPHRKLFRVCRARDLTVWRHRVPARYTARCDGRVTGPVPKLEDHLEDLTADIRKMFGRLTASCGFYVASVNARGQYR